VNANIEKDFISHNIEKDFISQNIEKDFGNKEYKRNHNMSIINGTFNTDLNGWNATGAASWDNGRVYFTSGGTIYQTFTVSDNLLQFDWETIGYSPSAAGLEYQLYIDDILKLSKMLPGNYNNPLQGTSTIYLGNYIGRNAKILFHEIYNKQGWIDNVIISHTTGVYNGNFNLGLEGWETTGNVTIEERLNQPIAGIYSGGKLEQTFIINQCLLSFYWDNGSVINGYDIYVDNVLALQRTIQEWSSGIESIDTSQYIGKTVKISFWCNGDELRIDDVQTSIDAFGISVTSYPPGAEIYLDNISTGQTTIDTPIIVYAGSEGQHTITLKLTGYPDYVDTVNVTKCIVSYMTGVFTGCITFISNPPGAKICIDNTYTGEITPKTFCEYEIDSYHTYSLYLKDYRIETDDLNFVPDKGILIDKNLIHETGSINFNVTPNGAKIILGGVDTGNLTPSIINDISTGYHNYEIRLDGYYSLTGSFRSIVDTVKEISDSLQQITGVINGTFNTDLSGWTITSTNFAEGYIEWVNGRAHLITNNIPISISQDFIATEDSLVFTYSRVVSLNNYCDMGWRVLLDPDTPEQTIIANYCGYGSESEYWGNFEVDVSPYIGRTIRLIAYLNGMKVVYIGGPAEAYLDNVGNIPRPTRSMTFQSYCTTISDCPSSSLQLSQCPAEISIDGTIVGYGTTITDLSIGPHSWRVGKDRNYTLETFSKYIGEDVSFIQGTPTHNYIDNIYTPAQRIYEFHYESPDMVSTSSCASPNVVHSITMPGIYYEGQIRYSWDVNPGYAWAGVYTQIFKNTEPIGELHDTGLNSGETFHYEDTLNIILDAGDTLSLVTWGKGPTYTCEYYVVSNVILETIPPTLTSIVVSPPTADVIIGGIQQFVATCKDQNDDEMICPILTWDTTDHTVGTISGTGLFTGISEGISTVTATSAPLVGSAIVTVIPIVQAGPGDIGKILLGGFLIGALLPKECKDYKYKKDCLKAGCEWINGKCVKRMKNVSAR